MNEESKTDSAIRKEIFDHLRNLQKAEEISAKRSGINIWVLWGALWFVAWQLFDNAKLIGVPAFIEISLCLILISQAFQILIQPTDKNHIGEEPRFLNFNILSLSETPSALVISILWSMAPAATYWVMFGFSFISILIGGLTGIVFYIFSREAFKKKSRFPKPTFKSSSPKTLFILSIIVVAACIIEILHVAKLLPTIETGAGRLSILVAATYWLISLLLEAQQKNYTDAWTYRTERELLLGIITTEDALRRIEQRYLGARLSAVMDDYWRDISNQFEIANKLLQTFKVESTEIQKIPNEYTEERKVRTLKSANPLRDTLKKLLADLQEFSQYTDEMLASQKLTPNKNVIEAIGNAIRQNKQAMSKLNDLTSEYELERKTLGMIPD